MPDIFTLLRQLYQRIAKPLFQRFSFRVTSRGFVWVGLWTFLVVFYSLLNLLSNLGIFNHILLLVLSIYYWLVIGITVFVWLAILIDYILLLVVTSQRQSSFRKILQFERTLNSNLSVQSWERVVLTLSLSSTITPKLWAWLKMKVIDNYHSTMLSRDLPIYLDEKYLQAIIDDNKSQPSNQPKSNQSKWKTDGIDIVYELYPQKRGYANFDGIDILFSTRLGLLAKYIHIPEHMIDGTHEVRVLANFSQIVNGQLVGISQKTALLGLLKQRSKGQGQDFHQIRNYSEGDSIRYLDWKATSRYHRLMTREYQDERDQQILFLLDCGQHMRHLSIKDNILQRQDIIAKHNTGSHLDQALNSMLLLAEVANEQGDATGFINFASDNDKIITPKKGNQVISYLLNQSFDIQPSHKLPDYLLVAHTVRKVQKKRSLIILITNTRQEAHSELFEAVKLLATNHIVVVANLYEEDLQAHLKQTLFKIEDALTYHTIQEYLNMRQQLHSLLSAQSSIYAINCTPSELPTKLIYQYLSIKRQHNL